MKRVVIVGAGLAGLAAAERLSRSKAGFDVIVIDQSKTATFWPLLPDCIGRGLSPELMEVALPPLSRRYRFAFIRHVVSGFDFQKKTVLMEGMELGYDYLLVAAGTKANFYGNNTFRSRATTSDSIAEVLQLRRRLCEQPPPAVVVAGGGYTGIEFATNVWRLFRQQGIRGDIVLVERSGSILGPLPEAMKDFVQVQLRRMGVTVLCDTTVTGVGDTSVTLSDGRSFERAELIWTAGVRAPECIARLRQSQGAQARLRVNSYLQFGRDRFAAGDCALYSHQGKAVRMSVQTALMQGDLAAQNIIATEQHKPLRKFHPVDYGFAVPLANGQSCGLAFGTVIRGGIATALHYVMCAVRSRGFLRRMRILSNMFT